MMKKCLWSLLLLAPTLLAQNDLQANVNLQFRFVNPGARAQAMGGAFIGLADDTTALLANPAGLAQMRSSTLVLEGNHHQNDHSIPFYSGSITQTDLQDFEFDLENRDFSSSKTSLPFLGYVNAKTRYHWGLFVAEQSNFERSFETNGIAIPSFFRFVERNQLEFFPNSTNATQLKLRSLGLASAAKLGEKVALGLTLTYNQLDYMGKSVFHFPNLEELFPDVRFSARDLLVLRPLYGQDYVDITVDGQDEALGGVAGLLLTPTERFSIGMAYKYQPKFDYAHTALGRNDDFEWLDPVSGVSQFAVPDSYGIGVSFKPSEVTILSVEVNRLAYSELSDTFTAFFPNDNDPVHSSIVAKDTTEYHVGLEHIITSTTFPLALRVGYYAEPYHALQNELLDTQLLFRYRNQNDTFVQGARATAFLQRFAKDLNHITFGMGLTMGSVVLDASADIDEENASYSLSSIYRFK